MTGALVACDALEPLLEMSMWRLRTLRALRCSTWPSESESEPEKGDRVLGHRMRCMVNLRDDCELLNDVFKAKHAHWRVDGGRGQDEDWFEQRAAERYGVGRDFGASYMGRSHVPAIVQLSPNVRWHTLRFGSRSYCAPPLLEAGNNGENARLVHQPKQFSSSIRPSNHIWQLLINGQWPRMAQPADGEASFELSIQPKSSQEFS